MSLFLIVCVLFCLVACDKSQPASNQGSNNAGQQSAQQATQKPTQKVTPKPTQKPTPEPCDHYYTSEVTVEATCAKTGTKKYTCLYCDNSYTEPIAKKTSHNWEYATCTKPDTCKDCGTTRGQAKGHSDIIGKCSRCGIDLGSNFKIITKLPITLFYGSTSIEITEASVSSVKSDLYFNWSGKMTYQASNNGTNSVYFDIIVRDSEGYVIESRIVKCGDLKVGDKAKGRLGLWTTKYNSSESYTIELVEHD